MVTIRALATIGVLVTLGSEASIAMPPQDIPAEIKSCKAIVDDKERLKCFDGLFGEIPMPQNPPEGAQANWSVDETKSPIRLERRKDRSTIPPEVRTLH